MKQAALSGPLSAKPLAAENADSFLKKIQFNS
jgi:hypothetical protein